MDFAYMFALPERKGFTAHEDIAARSLSVRLKQSLSVSFDFGNGRRGNTRQMEMMVVDKGVHRRRKRRDR